MEKSQLAEPYIEETHDGSLTLYSQRYQQSYASNKGAYRESMHVFLEGTGIATRLGTKQKSKVLEVGLGTGLNFLLTADLAVTHGVELTYHALEHTLLTRNILESLHYNNYIATPLWHAWLAWRDTLPETPPENIYLFSFESVTLKVYVGEALTQTLPHDCHAIYMDAFSPEVNAELWHKDFLIKLYDALISRGILATYCVKGEIRRRLIALGFDVRKRKGPEGGKREVLQAEKV